MDELSVLDGATAATSDRAPTPNQTEEPAPPIGNAVLECFADDLDHLAALERQAMLMLAVAFLRRNPDDDSSTIGGGGKFRQCFRGLPPGTDQARAERLLVETACRNRLLEAAAERQGVALHFTDFCRGRGLTPFERAAVLLLFMHSTAPHFLGAFRKSGFDFVPTPGPFVRNDADGMQVGTLLAIGCADYRDQTLCRRSFSRESALVDEEVFLIGGIGSETNLLGAKVQLHERVVRRILGDTNSYRGAMRLMRRERGSVRLEQVVLPDGVKEEVVTVVGNYPESRAAGRLDALDAFFGYGTGLALLFPGPPGTGKTMLSRALASRFGRRLITFAVEDFARLHMGPEEMLALVFREAA